ncbi:hypothetical protein LINPERHAP2_LOCUS20652, partial [Linum perenne]
LFQDCALSCIRSRRKEKVYFFDLPHSVGTPRYVRLEFVYVDPIAELLSPKLSQKWWCRLRRGSGKEDDE